MKDLDKEFDENLKEDADGEKRTIEDGGIYCDQNSKDGQTSTENFEEESEVQVESDAGEEENAEEETKNPAEEKENNAEQISADKGEVHENVAPKCSSYYSPPYYVPNFTVTNSGNEQEDEKNKKSKSSLTGWKVLVAAVSILCILLVAAATVVLVGYLNKGFFANGVGDLENEELFVIQNSPQMNITENTDSNYVPQSLPEVVQKVGNSVVEIRTSSLVTDRFYGQYVTSGAGSGVIITQSNTSGYIITNNHVIDGAEEITVELTNKEEYTASVLDKSKNLDLAVLKITKKSNETFTVANIGNSSNLLVGQEIIAIGNPLGSLGGTVTNGIISALDRKVSVDGVSMTLLQHNAAINPGNSGGGLFDMMGNLVGIVNAKSSDTGIEGLGFAIPVNIAFEYFKSVMQAPTMGIIVDYATNRTTGVKGVYVFNAVAESPFKYSDRIVKIGETEINSLDDYYACVDSLKTEESVSVVVERNKKQITLEVTLQKNES